jgi:DNA-directed RNA polymerase subunit alpha
VLNLNFDAGISNEASNSELKNFLITVDSLGLSVRSFNSLDKAGIKYLGEIVLMDENDLKNIKNLGKRSLEEIREVLNEHGFNEDFELDDEVRLSLTKKIKQLKEI